MTQDDDRYLDLGGLVAYSTLSARTIRRYMADQAHPLPAHRLGGRVLFKRSEFDQWLRDRETRTSRRDDEEVRRVVRDLRGYAAKG